MVAFSGIPELFYLFVVALVVIHKDAIFAAEDAAQLRELTPILAKTDPVELVNLAFDILDECRQHDLFRLQFQWSFKRLGDFYYDTFPFGPTLDGQAPTK
jgi:hypothetical protein